MSENKAKEDIVFDNNDLLKKQTFTLETEIKTKVSWETLPENNTEREERKAFENVIINVANFINKDLSRVILTAIQQGTKMQEMAEKEVRNVN